MALTINIATSQFGVPFNGAYFRVVTAAISRTRDPENRFMVMVDVAGYVKKPMTEDDRDIDFRRYHAPLVDIESQVGADFLAKCYAWVSAQPDMSGAAAV